MSRLVSFVVLVAVILVVAVLFFRVILEFVVPMFLAAVLVVIFRPMHKWFEYKLAGHPRLAAAATTLCIMLIVLVPIVAIGWNAYREVAALAREALDEETPYERPSVEPAPDGRTDFEPINDSTSVDGDSPESETQPEKPPTELQLRMDKAIGAVLASLQRRLDIEIPYTAKKIREELEGTIGAWLRERGGTAALGGVRAGLRIVVGLVIMIISVYFFLADGPGMLVTIMQLSPLDDRYELELLSKFSNISRAVVVATLLSAFVQGVLAGIGYYVAGIQIVFALTGLTMLLAVVPFLGAASVWAPTAAWLLLGEDRPVAAIVLALYGLCVVSTIDNFIKPYVLHGQSNLHPLLALLSVLGGVAAMGPIGILVGPMAVAFLQALLGMLRREIDELGEEGTVLSTSPEPGAAKIETQRAITGGNKQGRSNDSTPEPATDEQAGKPDPAPKRGAPQPKRSRRSARRRKRS